MGNNIVESVKENQCKGGCDLKMRCKAEVIKL